MALQYIEVFCPLCGTAFEKETSRQTKYCSEVCAKAGTKRSARESYQRHKEAHAVRRAATKEARYAQTAEWKRRNKAHLLTQAKEYANRTYFGGLRELVIERDQHSCTRCGQGESLIVHHLDGDTMHNVLSNLTTLCRGCHARVHGLSRWN